MKLTKETLKQIIKEELEAVLNEDGNDAAVRRGAHGLAGSTSGDDKEKRRSAAFKSDQQTKQNQFDNIDKIAADLGGDGRFKSEPGAKQTSINDKFDQQDDVDAVRKKANKMTDNVVPFIEDDIDRFAKKKGISTEELRKKLSSFLMSTKAAREMQPYLVDILGQKTFDSLMSGQKRSSFSKLANKIKGGKFAENKRRR